MRPLPTLFFRKERMVSSASFMLSSTKRISTSVFSIVSFTCYCLPARRNKKLLRFPLFLLPKFCRYVYELYAAQWPALLPFPEILPLNEAAEIRRTIYVHSPSRILLHYLLQNKLFHHCL